MRAFWVILVSTAVLAGCGARPPAAKKPPPAPTSLTPPIEGRRPPPPPPPPPEPPKLVPETLQSTFDCSGPQGQNGVPTVRSYVKFYPDGVFVELVETYRAGVQVPGATSVRVGSYTLSGNMLTRHQTGRLEDMGVWSATRHSDELQVEAIENWTWSRYTRRVVSRTVNGTPELPQVLFGLCQREDAYGAKLDPVRRELDASFFRPDRNAAGADSEKALALAARTRLLFALNYVNGNGAPLRPGIAAQCQAAAIKWTQALATADSGVNALLRTEKTGASTPQVAWSGYRTMYDAPARQAVESGCVPAR